MPRPRDLRDARGSAALEGELLWILLRNFAEIFAEDRGDLEVGVLPPFGIVGVCCIEAGPCGRWWRCRRRCEGHGLIGCGEETLA